VERLPGEGGVQMFEGDVFPTMKLHTRGECIMGHRITHGNEGRCAGGRDGKPPFSAH
jgi:hypothetical protein